MKLSNNKILITGGSRGIGLALTNGFLEKGNTVIIVASDAKRLEQLQNTHSNLHVFPCDLSKKEELDRLFVFIENQHSDVNVLINNAGIQHSYSFSEEKHLLTKIDFEVAVNLIAPLKLTAALLPLLEQNENSAIVNISSALAIVPKRQSPVYCATKGAIHIFSESIRAQLHKTQVFEVLPPLVETNMTKGRGGNKISADALAAEFFNAFEKDKLVINIGKVKLLRLLHRIYPALAKKLINRSA